MYVQDKNSMLHLTRAIDRATGYIFLPPLNTEGPPGTVDMSQAPTTSRPNTFSLLSTAAGPMHGPGSDVRDIQERWVDYKEQWDAYEKVQWRKEGEIAQDEAARRNNNKS
jgi:phospholipase C